MTYPATILATPGLVAYWPLDEASGDALDRSGNGHTLTVVASGTTYGEDGIVPSVSGTAMAFDGTQGIPALATGSPAFAFSPNAPASFEVWYRTPILPDDGGVFIGNGFLYLVTYAGDFVMERYWSDVQDNVAGGLIAVDTTYYIVGTYDGANVRIYVNGALTGGPVAAEEAADTASSRLSVGGYISNGYPARGTYNHVAAYNADLSPGTIAAHYAAGIGPDGTLTANVQILPVLTAEVSIVPVLTANVTLEPVLTFTLELV